MFQLVTVGGGWLVGDPFLQWFMIRKEVTMEILRKWWGKEIILDDLE